MKLNYLYTLKALWDGQGKIKMYYGMSRVKKQLSRKRSIVCRFTAEIHCFSWWFQTDNMTLYMDSMILVVVTLGEYLTLKNNCDAFWSHIFG